VAQRFTPGGRFFATLGFSILQAAIFGSTVAALLYFRVPRVVDEEGEDLASYAFTRARGGLERAESFFYDWRARALGRASAPTDAEVAVVAIDEESVANARRGEQAVLAQHPWPRQVLGSLVDRILAEGARLVVIDLPLWDASPSCPGTDEPTSWAGDDDGSFRAALDRRPGKTVLGFQFHDEPAPGSPQLRPYLALVDQRPSDAEARESVRRVLSERRPAYVIGGGKDGKVQVWAGVQAEEEGRALARRWDPKATPTVRALLPADRASEVTPVDLLVSMSAVEVEGLDPARVPRARSLEHPFAPLLGPRSGFGSASFLRDEDGVVRGVPHLVNYAPREGQVRLLPSVVLEAALELAGTRKVRYGGGRLFVGDRFSIPVDDSGYGLLRWEEEAAARDARGSLKRVVSAWRLLVNLEDARHGLPPHYRNDLDGRVVILEDSTSYSTDRVDTPIGEVPGGSVMAQAMVNLLKSDGVERSEPRWDAGAAFALAFLGAFLALTFASSLRSLGGLLAYLAALVAVASMYLWVAHQTFVEDRV